MPHGTMLGWAVAIAWGMVLAPRPAHACGGGFGVDVEIEPQQRVGVFVGDGSQTYAFAPKFCGPPAEFGLILPIPGPLRGDPAELDADLWDAFEALTEPETVIDRQCESSDGAGGLRDGAAMGGVGGGGPGGVDVIGEGMVGVFEWKELEATSASAFTDWLDERAFPYDAAAMDAFAHYVEQGWRFVAFTMDATAVGGTIAGSGGIGGFGAAGVAGGAGVGGSTGPGTVCGAFDPIGLTFDTDAPVIPARIAVSADHSLGVVFDWRVFAVASTQMKIAGIPQAEAVPVGEDQETVGGGSGEPAAVLRFAGELSDDEVERYAEIEAVAKSGQWLTEIDVSFMGGALDDDLYLEAASDPTPFRRIRVEVVEEPCDGGLCRAAARAPHGSATTVLLLLGALGFLQRRRRRGRAR